MIFLYILLGILAALGLLLLCDVRIIVEYHEEFSFHIGFLFICYPFKNKKVSKSVTKAAKTKEQQPQQKKAPKLKIEFILRVIREFIALLGRINEHTRLNPCRVRILVAEEDAAETALAYGRYCAMLGALEALLKGNFAKVKADFGVGWNFEPDSTGTKFDLKLAMRIRLFRIIISKFWKPLLLIAELQEDDKTDDQTQNKSSDSKSASDKEPVKTGK